MPKIISGYYKLAELMILALGLEFVFSVIVSVMSCSQRHMALHCLWLLLNL